MSSKLSESDQRYKSLGFERTFDGSAGGIQWSELIEELKTNVLRQNLRVRKFIMGEYDTTVSDRDLAKVPSPLPADWDAPVKRQCERGARGKRCRRSRAPRALYGDDNH